MKNNVKLFLLLGDPVEGTLSPAIHNSAFRTLGLNNIYVPVKVQLDNLPEIVEAIRNLKVAGFNVTVPHKVSIIGLLDKLDESASSVQAVNTVVNRGGKLVGYNTDGEGALQNIQSKIGPVKNKRVVILGAGGAARAIAYSMAKAGADVTVANRTPARGKALAAIIRKRLRKKIALTPLRKPALKKSISSADILINATTVGMEPKPNETLVTADMLHPKLVVNDIVYKPMRTKLLKEAERAGAKTIDGLGMLVNQAAISFKIWTRSEPPVKVMSSAARKTLGG